MWIEVSRKYLSFCVPMSAILSAKGLCNDYREGGGVLRLIGGA